jgi:hypothetical protein
MKTNERIGCMIQKRIFEIHKPENVGRLLAIARDREIAERGNDVYVSATLIAILGYSYETLKDMANNEQHMEEIKEGLIRQSLESPLKKEDKDDA